jgi:peroxiredoxin
MAVIVDNVYQKVLALANKEQRGYVTPQEFNLLADKAQNEIFQNYFHSVKMSVRKPNNQAVYADEVERIEEKLQPFYVSTNAQNTSTASLDLPGTMHRLISVEAISAARGTGKKLTPLNKSEIAYTENNPLTKATLARSVFVREASGNITIFPAPSTATYNVDTSIPADGVLDAESFQINYYRVPSAPNWGYVVSNEEALYNANASTHFELHASEEENLVSRILMLAGVVIQKPEIQQAGVQDIQLIKQQQNS